MERKGTPEENGFPVIAWENCLVGWGGKFTSSIASIWSHKNLQSRTGIPQAGS